MLKRNWYFLLPAILIALPVLLTLWFMVNYGYGFEDAWKSVRHFGASNTRYTQYYSETNFNRVRAGMSGREVYEVMRMQPFERRNQDEQWLYSLPQGDTPYYHQRTIIFARDKQNVPRVQSVIKRFHTPDAP